ncbi:hypothetical protein TrST_g2045 [Triparma strigata]|uniref:tRNA (adenine(58)-N(1))-methyltransferase n=1 Tax=Triparma strigata TaxID=1606541 RepID=A0A9W7ERQ1_9STRA|nr:hypothetical protein TrST_g2045 [Triparma strigata]
MDFAKSMVSSPGPSSSSNLSLVAPSSDEDNNGLRALNVIASNEALMNELGCEAKGLVESHIPRSNTITPSSLCVIFASYASLSFVYATPNQKYSNRNGVFHHNDFIGKEFGVKVPSRCSDGFVYIMRPTVELWAHSLNHRTQICHPLDQSVVTLNLHLKPGSIVLESGTGSGAMSHALSRAVAPNGKVWSYEFNKVRAETANEEFKKNGVDNICTCEHRDVCGEGFGESCGDGGADGIFLDLPEPWTATEHALRKLRPDGRLCSYSPCIEQTQRFVKTLSDSCHSVTTIEVRLKEFCVDTLPALPMEISMPFYYGTEKVDKARKDKVKAEEERKKKEAEEGEQPKRKKIRTRPAAEMRGHTAFLTFATKSVPLK